MLTVDSFKNLSTGDQIEGPPLFRRLSDEPIVLLTVLKTKTRAEFVVSFAGVTLGRWVCVMVNGELQWNF